METFLHLKAHKVKQLWTTGLNNQCESWSLQVSQPLLSTVKNKFDWRHSGHVLWLLSTWRESVAPLCLLVTFMKGKEKSKSSSSCSVNNNYLLLMCFSLSLVLCKLLHEAAAETCRSHTQLLVAHFTNHTFSPLIPLKIFSIFNLNHHYLCSRSRFSLLCWEIFTETLIRVFDRWNEIHLSAPVSSPERLTVNIFSLVRSDHVSWFSAAGSWNHWITGVSWFFISCFTFMS